WNATATAVAGALNSPSFGAIGGSGASVSVTSSTVGTTTTYTITFNGGTLAGLNVNQINAAAVVAKNTYTGTTTVNDGTLLLVGPQVIIPGNLVIGDGIGNDRSAT